MILRVPGKTDGGMRTKALSEFVDIYPTLSELCGLEIPKHCEGDSMVPLLENPDRDWKSVAFSQYQKKESKRKLVFLGTSVRDQQWRYTEWRDVETDKLDRVELYDLKNDPNQTKSVHGIPKNEPVLKRLAALAAKSATGVNPPSH
jgi:arylsulfatase A-like enzyme